MKTKSLKVPEFKFMDKITPKGTQLNQNDCVVFKYMWISAYLLSYSCIQQYWGCMEDCRS